MKILAVLPRFPYPLEKGDKLRAYHQLRLLAQNNEIYLFCTTHSYPSQSDIHEVKQFCRDIHVVRLCRLGSCFRAVAYFVTGRSMQIGYWNASKARRNFVSYLRSVAPDVIYCQMIRTLSWVQSAECPKVLDFQDALSLNTNRRADRCNPLLKPIFRLEAKRIHSVELSALRQFDSLTIISQPDKEALANGTPLSQNIHIVTNGIDTDHFSPLTSNVSTDIVFCGNMQYEPNVTASRFLVEKVMPIVWKELPNAIVTLAGANPSLLVRRLQSDKVRVTGWVEDIRPCYASARIFVAPMMSGSGMQNKLLEAMSMGVPCITTSIANKPLGATIDNEILVGDTPEQLAKHIVTLLNDPSQRARLVAAATDFVHSHYSWHTSVNQLQSILTHAVENHNSPNL